MSLHYAKLLTQRRESSHHGYGTIELTSGRISYGTKRSQWSELLRSTHSHALAQFKCVVLRLFWQAVRLCSLERLRQMMLQPAMTAMTSKPLCSAIFAGAVLECDGQQSLTCSHTQLARMTADSKGMTRGCAAASILMMRKCRWFSRVCGASCARLRMICDDAMRISVRNTSDYLMLLV